MFKPVPPIKNVCAGDYSLGSNTAVPRHGVACYPAGKEVGSANLAYENCSCSLPSYMAKF
jgi:hypothetical protein